MGNTYYVKTIFVGRLSDEKYIFFWEWGAGLVTAGYFYDSQSQIITIITAHQH